jgi:hypothetical protein
LLCGANKQIFDSKATRFNRLSNRYQPSSCRSGQSATAEAQRYDLDQMTIKLHDALGFLKLPLLL